MEFVSTSEVEDLLTQQGYVEVQEGDDRRYVSIPDQDGVVHLHFADGESATKPRENAEVISTPVSELPAIIEQVIHRLNLADLLLIPVAKWRNVFDAVAFSMASNEDWQEVDAAASVELNTRDPLYCGPADFPLVIELIKSLISDAEAPEQGLILTSTAVPVVCEVVPDGAVRFSVGNQALADEVMDLKGT